MMFIKQITADLRIMRQFESKLSFVGFEDEPADRYQFFFCSLKLR